MAKNFQKCTLMLMMSSFLNCCPKIASAQSPNTAFRKSPTNVEIKAGIANASKWGASLAWFPDYGFRIGLQVLGPYNNYTGSTEIARPSITTVSLVAGWGISSWHSKFKGSAIEGHLGTATTDRETANPIWNYGYQGQFAYALYTDKKGLYGISVYGQIRRLFVVLNNNRHGLAYDSHEKANWVFNYGVALFF